MAIRMKALRSFGQGGVNEGHVKRGREFSTVSEQRCKDIEAHGLAYRIDFPKAAMTPVAIVATDKNNEASEQGPFVSAGGETGAGAPAPSSDRVHRRRRRR